MKIKAIKIKPLKEIIDDAKVAMKLATQGKGKEIKEPTVYFESLEAARRFLTNERLKLLSAIKAFKPKSIYELAKITGKNIKNVSDDVNFLKELGILNFKESKTKRKSKKPVLLCDQIHVQVHF